MKSILMGVTALALAGCATTPKPPISAPDAYRIAKVAVMAGCVVDAPAPVVPLLSVPDDEYNALAPGAKAERFKAQAGLHMQYEDDLRRATKACQPAKAP